MWALLLITGLVVVVPSSFTAQPKREANSFAPPSWYDRTVQHECVLGTDYLGRSYAAVLGRAISATTRVAFFGTAAVLFGVLAVGTLQGSTQSKLLGAILASGNLGVMAVPQVAVLITIATSWSRTSPAWMVNTSMMAVLVLFAIPTGARLIAERVRSVNQTRFVAASQAFGASWWYTFRRDVFPHLLEDIAWIVASVLPMFVAVEVGLAYLGIEYREFEGLGRALAKSFGSIFNGIAQFQLVVTIAVILWVALIPQIILKLLNVRGFAEESV
ncbi:hypothetical protein C2E31_05480 [Rhodopirellula baltica]|nr:hypothetical protein C2E31_05480 [Rhodopirellula baltica]